MSLIIIKIFKIFILVVQKCIKSTQILTYFSIKSQSITNYINCCSKDVCKSAVKPHLFMTLYYLLVSLFFCSCAGIKTDIDAEADHNISTISKASEDLNSTQSLHDILSHTASKAFSTEKYPGMAVIVWKDGTTILSEGLGYADLEKHIPISPKRSKFRIGSISKTLTTSALAKLVERKIIDLDESVHTYVKEELFPKKNYDISLRQLAGHIAGIRHYKGLEFMSNTYYPTVSEGLNIFSNDSLLFEPGTQYSYSSYGYNLLSAAMESASKTPFLELMQDEVFNPLGLYNTSPEFSHEHTFNLVKFYCASKEGSVNPCPEVDNSYKWAGGGFISTAEDVLLFGKTHILDEFLPPTLFKEWTSAQHKNDGKSTNYGIGWGSGTDKKDRHWIGHSGGSVGGNSMMLLYPDQQLIVVVFINQSPGKASETAFKLAHQVLAQKNGT